ncbi:MAG TPA: alpha-amylase family glycosyl hydrolase, partial [Fimbriimonas sp.]|nr:alpha-amylase family glycosyl hydrolase [Fimbriimonas sp.]
GAQLDWIGNTNTYNMGSPIPTVGAYMQPYASVTVTTQTFPIASGQSVSAIVTTDNWQTTTEVPFNFDQNVGNNTQWYGIIGPFPQGKNVQFYLRARGNNAADKYDSNGGQNFGYTWRYNPASRRGAILQWFATDYQTILKRLPDIVNAGYGALYLPPPSKSGGGGFSVGYNPVDRFDLGDRLLMGTVKTRYGTTEDLINLTKAAKQYGIEVYIDLVTNHNDNRGSWAINRYPDMIPEDFHIRSSEDTGNDEINFNNAGPLSFAMLNHDLVGLVDIAHENGNQTQTGAFNLPSYAGWNMWGKPWFIRHPLTPQYYPGGTAVQEDSREYLKRFCWYMLNVVGVDGFRIDAVKHTTPSFFMKAIGQAGYDSNNADLLPYIYSQKPNAMVFGEVLTSNGWELREYAKTGIEVLDFPLAFNLRSIFGAGGFGNIGSLANGFGIDASNGLGYQNGGVDPEVGVSFVQSHDDGPPQSNNLAYAFILTRPGSAKVYYDGNNLNPGDYGQFPRPGRFDALGNASDITRRIVDVRNRFGRGTLFNRFTSDDLYIYERHVNGSSILLVGLNDRGDTDLTQTVTTAFPVGTELEDLSGQRPNVTVNGSHQVTITVPSNSTPTNNNNAQGYVLYAPVTAKPDGNVMELSVPGGGVLTPQTVQLPAGSYSASFPTSYQIATITTDSVNLAINTTSAGNTAYVKLDNGNNGPWYQVLSNTPEGLKDGFMATTKLSNGRFVINNLDVSRLTEGRHVLRARVFNNSNPEVFSEFTYWFDLRRGNTSNWVIDGDLAEFGPNANWWQTRTPSSNANRLDGVFVSNDDQYLYIGLAGRVDTTESLTNGMVALIDPEVGISGGSANLGVFNDDSGPLARLLSNTSITFGTSMRPKYAVGSFRHQGISSSPESLLVTGTGVPPTVGAQAGTFWLNPSTPSRLSGLKSMVAVQPRGSISSPLKGLEAAIPLSQILPKGASGYNSVGILAYLGSTGEAGTTLLSTDPLRGVLGGYPQARSWVSNQFLPAQPAVVNDPGTSPVNITQHLTYNFKRASFVTGLQALPSAVVPGGVGQSSQVVTIRNNTANTINGPIWLTVALGPRDFTTLANKRGDTFFGGKRQYVQVQPGALAAGAQATFTLQWSGANAHQVQASYTALAGQGAP